jgi:hypothetical protein
MSTATRDEIAERIAELHRQDWPRFSLDHLLGEVEPGSAGRALLSAAETPENVPIINAYLKGYVPGDCPSCGYGRFGWGISYGAGSCSCGWPGRLYHHILDNRELPELVCAATCNGHDVCGRPRGEHEEVEETWFAVADGAPSIHRELRCPDPTPPPGIRSPFRSQFRPPLIVHFNAMLWAHPYTVHLNKS